MDVIGFHCYAEGHKTTKFYLLPYKTKFILQATCFKHQTPNSPPPLQAPECPPGLLDQA